jgi:membrane fusion protein (multidrug efflux system)
MRRRSALIASGAVSKEDFAHSQDITAAQSAALDAARAALEETIAQIAGTTIANHPDVLAAAAKVRNAALGLRRTSITAPVDGVVAKRGVQIGQHIDAGTPLMAVISLRNIWIDANFKEVQLNRMRVGQPVVVHADLYGGGIAYRGKLAGLSAGSGGAFSLLPAQNATGNWIKIVQRVPVRILLDPQDVAAHPLRVGLSARVQVDVSDTSGPLMASEVRSEPFPAMHSDADDPAVAARIAKIIADNGGEVKLSEGGGR